ncbi:YicC/YloC family endoribonuclease [Azotosporobacter soli]|uniref:YicC/YloC family endoribonuclease n=1 Tax=Azotosporobacter soli TaxID=3055040 RepID=UPI0031FE8A89
MLKSMTGFGRGEFLDGSHRFLVEIKAVNHRYNEFSIRMPKTLGPLEDRIRRKVADQMSRGRIDIFITMDEYAHAKRRIRVDKELAIAYHNALRELADLLATPLTDSLHQVAKYPDVVQVEEETEDVELLWLKLGEAIGEAVDNLMQMRRTEGANLAQDLDGRLAMLLLQIEKVEERAPAVLEEYRKKMLDRMREMLQAVGAEPDEARILQEAAVFSDKISIAEELVRLKSHVKQFRVTLQSTDAVGRKLDFLVQEINRETNTIASKANDYMIANLVVDMKSEIEKMREQIQNIE